MITQIFARKLILPFAGVTEEDIQNEISAINKFNTERHRNVIVVLNHSWLRDSPCYAIDMELCDFTLADYIAQKEEALQIIERDTKLRASERILKWHRISTIMKDVSEGLAFIHRLKQAHRDLKPSNSDVFRS